MIYVVVHDTKQGIATFPFTTKKKAEKAVADHVVSRLDEIIDDDDVQQEIREAHEDGLHGKAMRIWNDWSIEAEYRDEYWIDKKKLDEPL